MFRRMIFAGLFFFTSCNESPTGPEPAFYDLGELGMPFVERPAFKWMPDAEHIAYMRPTSREPGSEVTLFRKSWNDSLTEEAIMKFPLGTTLLDCDWTRDRFLVTEEFTCQSRTTTQIRELTLQGAVLGAYSPSCGYSDLVARVSPDGSMLAFIRSKGDSVALYVRSTSNYDALPSHFYQLSRTGDFDVTSISWARDSTLLVTYLQNEEPHGKLIDLRYSYGISWPVPANSTDISPDGVFVTFAIEEFAVYQKKSEVYLARLDPHPFYGYLLQNETRLRNDLTIKNSPVWSPDGRKIAYSSRSPGTTLRRLQVASLPPLR